MKAKDVFSVIAACLAALCIPGALMLNAVQSRKYKDLQTEVLELEKKQEKLVEENKTLIQQISVLSNSDRIESIAKSELGMRPAESDEIVRVEMTGSTNK